MFSNEGRSSLEKSTFQLLGLLYNYIKHSRCLLLSLHMVSACFLENHHSKLSMWNGMGACAATKPCCHPPVCKLKHAGGSKKENLKNSALQGQGKLELTSAGMETSHLPCEQPKRNLLSAFMWILVPFPHLQSPEGAASAKVTAGRRFLAMHLRKRQRPSSNKP